MRNLKRVLALAMAMVMILGMMVIGSSAAKYSDESAIDAKYADAVEILSGMGVFQGTGAGFAPKQILDRASAAALVYRVITGDVKDKQVELYDYSSFADVQEGAWYTPYITYAANGGYIKGYAGNAMPNETVTGIQVLAMMLRAAGYGQNGEFEGAAWKDGILTVAKELGITAGISTNDLDKGATRELVAQLIWNAIYEVNMVAYSPILNDYIPVTVTGAKDNKISFATTQTLAQKVFYLDETNTHDHWGRPETIYFDWRLGQAKGHYATIEAIPDAVYTTEVTECDIAEDLGLKVDGKVVAETLNGDAADATNGYVELKFNATKKVGAQGRLTEVYDLKDGIEIVYIDQYLAKVVKTTEVEYDKNGHIDEKAKLYLDIYDVETANDAVALDVVLESNENYEYSRNDMLLVYLDNDGADTFDAKVDTVEIVDYADVLTGKQTKLTTKASHVVEGIEYLDAVRFNLDQAGNETIDHIWYFDTYGNLIGVVDVADVYTFGTISAIYWVDSRDGSNGYAYAQITYMDGTSEWAKVASIKQAGGNAVTLKGIEGDNATYGTTVSSTIQYNDAKYANKALYKIASGRFGLELTETTEIEGATLKTGVTTLKNGVAYADKNTMFLVWNDTTEKYETYTGIRNLPTYIRTYTIWAAEFKTATDVDAEYVFVNDPAVVNTTYALYFNTRVNDVETDLYLSSPDIYTVNGGYLNNVANQPIQILAEDGEDDYTDSTVWGQLNDTKGQLVVLTLENGYVVAANAVTADAVTLDNVNYAEYEGKLGVDVSINASETRLTGADGESYDIADIAAPIGTRTWAAAAGKYVWTVYTQNTTSDKTAQYVYVSDTGLVAAVDGSVTIEAKDNTVTLVAVGKDYVATIPYDATLPAVKGDVLNFVKFSNLVGAAVDTYDVGTATYTLVMKGQNYGADTTYTIKFVKAAAPAAVKVLDVEIAEADFVSVASTAADAIKTAVANQNKAAIKELGAGVYQFAEIPYVNTTDPIKHTDNAADILYFVFEVTGTQNVKLEIMDDESTTALYTESHTSVAEGTYFFNIQVTANGADVDEFGEACAETHGTGVVNSVGASGSLAGRNGTALTAGTYYYIITVGSDTTVGTFTIG